ncbi:hypothetical protein [Nocardia brasiliensis]|uniref:hypothetical protein n=1 Tax=Nocardia brasiliensis TaxID=37326 RepID=UPI00189307FE|nr:hypothetical protein [Nocardia brasiliensis]MBF6541552.1 hypothetical protein [Nocardia brasiliensis]
MAQFWCHFGRGDQMKGQWIAWHEAWNQTVSIQYSLAPVTAVVQMSLSSRFDWDEWATPIARAIAAWIRYRTADGTTHDLPVHTPTFYANDITEVSGLLISDNCHTDVVVNWFIWA